MSSSIEFKTSDTDPSLRVTRRDVENPSALENPTGLDLILMRTIVILTGVCGSGKSTVGEALAQKLGWPMAEGDDFHSAGNKEKMMHGTPLTDKDRIPWLLSLHQHICQWIKHGMDGIVTCSALKHLYRHILRHGMTNINQDVLTPLDTGYCTPSYNSQSVRFVFVLLKCSTEILTYRLQQRQGHFFSASLLQSQLETFEEPLHNEFELIVDGTKTVDEIVQLIVSFLHV